MIEDIRNEFLKNNIQIVGLDKKGKIVASDNTLFKLELKTQIQDFHPFFEVGIEQLLKKPNTQQTFYCVYIDIENQSRTFDIYLNSGVGKQMGYIIFHDLTERYQFFQTIAQEKNISVLSFREAELKNQQLKIQKEFKDKFLANVSHDLRTPISSILGFLEIFQQSEINKSQKDLLITVNNTAKHLYDLVEDLIDISRIESGQFNFKNKSFDFQDFADQVEKTYLQKTAPKRFQFIFNVDSQIPKVLIADKVRLFQIITNIMDNAVKFTETGNVTLSIKQNYRRADNVGVQIMVTDTGIGISNKNVLRAFESFTKLHNDEYGGLGLGLTIVNEIVTKLGGNLKLKSTLKVGTTIEVNLPLKIDMEQTARARKIVTKQFLSTDFPKKFKVLVVDDNETNQMLLLKMLSDHGGFFVDITDTATQALQVLEIEKYDIVIMDMNMPEINGFEAIKLIRKNSDAKIAKTPIMCISANPTVEEKRKVKEIGIKEYLPRPHTREELFLTIYKLLKVKKDFL